MYLSAVIALAQGQQVQAAQLLGSTDRSYQSNRLTFPLFRRQLIDQTIEDTRAALDEETFTTAWEAGKAMDLSEALVYALEVVEEIQPSIDRREHDEMKKELWGRERGEEGGEAGEERERGRRGGREEGGGEGKRQQDVLGERGGERKGGTEH